VPAAFDAPLDSKDHAEAEGRQEGRVDSEPGTEDNSGDDGEAGSEASGKAEGDPFGKVQGRAEGWCQGKPEGDSNPGAQGEPDRKPQAWPNRAPDRNSVGWREAGADGRDNGLQGDAHTGYRALTRTNPHLPHFPSRILGFLPKELFLVRSFGTEPSDGTCSSVAARTSDLSRPTAPAPEAQNGARNGCRPQLRRAARRHLENRACPQLPFGPAPVSGVLCSWRPLAPWRFSRLSSSLLSVHQCLSVSISG